mmetsp:Transcript_14595/g.29217  ORF Transcript_14595/g.29217 Transcript_14595/m.29217 type:complete len:108 (-) Transcript_14595:401-724(-)
MGVTSSGLHLKDSVVDGQEGDIEGTSSKIVDQDVLLTTALLFQTISNGSSSRLVDDTKHVETSDQTSVLGRLALRVVEVRGNGNNSVLDVLAKEALSSLLHLRQDHA